MRATYTTCLVRLNFIILILCGKQYTLWIFSSIALFQASIANRTLCALLDCYAGYSGNSLPKFRYNLLVDCKKYMWL